MLFDGKGFSQARPSQETKSIRVSSRTHHYLLRARLRWPGLPFRARRPGSTIYRFFECVELDPSYETKTFSITVNSDGYAQTTVDVLPNKKNVLITFASGSVIPFSSLGPSEPLQQDGSGLTSSVQHGPTRSATNTLQRRGRYREGDPCNPVLTCHCTILPFGTRRPSNKRGLF